MMKTFLSTLLVSAVAMAALQSGPLAAGTTADPAFTLDLGGQRFDPLVQPPQSATTSDNGPALRLIQFAGPIRPEWLDSLAGQGIQPLQYIHPYSYVVWSDSQSLSRAANLAGVRWRGDFLPEYKIPPAQRSLDAARHEAMVLVSRYADAAELVDAVEGLGATIKLMTQVNRHFSVAQIELPGDRFFALAQLPAVYAVQRIVPRTEQEMLRGEMSNQAVVGAYGGAPNFTIVPGFLDWLTDTGFDGTGVIAGIVDGGILSSHNDLSTQMAPCISAGGGTTSCGASHSDHGTHVAGAVAGSGASAVLSNGFLRGLGVAPGAKVISQRYGPFIGGGPGGMVANGMLTIFRESALSNAVITNNSWGPTGTPQGYDIPTQQIDIIARDALPEVSGQQPIIPVWSIMNGDGDANGACAPASIASPDEAKNLFAVGSTALQGGGGAQQSGIFNVSANSAHGNACDGRRIPHIVAPGCSTDSPTNSGPNAFTLMCGTSMASPVVTGAASLFIEKYRLQHAGATPSPALVKAAFTAVATNLEGFRNADNAVMGHRPDRFQGYGRLDLEAVINPAVPVMFIDQSELFTATGQSFSLPIAAAQPDQPMHIMLAWTDAPGHGLGGTTPAWVNDLDLSVATHTDSYLGNVVGIDGWSATGGTADTRNNLEGVFLNPTQHGGFVTLTVDATNIAADALNPHTPGSPAQDFALACYNCVMGEGFGLTVEPSAAQVCAPDHASTTVSVQAFGSFDGAVALTATDLPSGLTAQFDPAIVAPAPGASALILSDTDQVAPGAYAILIHGESVGETSRMAGFDLTIAASLPANPVPTFPAHAATLIPTTPTLEWSAALGATEYLVEVATDSAFSNLVFSTTTPATQATVSPLLTTSTRYWWRVTASNACGSEGSVVSYFTTEAAPGDCPLDSQPLALFAADFGDGLGEFSTTGSSGAQTWAISAARPSPMSGGNAAFAGNLATVSDQHLISPSIALPANQLPLTLKFQNWREIEQRDDTRCWDGGILEIAVDGGEFTQVPDSLLLNDPYRGVVDSGYENPLAGLRAWCNVPPRAWADTLVDLSSFAGSPVQLRWRLGTDNLIAEEGWFVDDIRVQSCLVSEQADLAIEKTVDADVAVIGTEVTFTLTARNYGSSDATDVVVNDLLPSGYSFVSAVASTGSYDDTSGVWTIGALGDGASEVLDITAVVLGKGDHLNVASIQGAENDNVLANNSDSASVTATDPPSADLSITKEVDATGGGVGATATFTLTAVNAGPSSATGVVVTDLLPDGYLFAGAAASTGTYDDATGEWMIGAMAVDATETLTITTIIKLEGSYDNSASIEGNESDPQAGNNSDSVSAEPVINFQIFDGGFESPSP